MKGSDLSSADLLKSKKEVPIEFNRVAVKYDFATSLSQGYQADLNRSVNRMGLTGNEYVADLCCGTGKSTAALLTVIDNGKVLGIDNSKGMLDLAEEKFSNEIENDKIKFELNDVMNLDFAENTFDAIFMAYGIRNMPDYKKCLNNLLKIIKPGGVICFHEYSVPENYIARIYWRLLGYLIIVPVSGLLSGSTKIFRYLIKSVLRFPAPEKFSGLLNESGFINCKRYPQSGWRKPILHTFIAYKP